MRKGQAEKPKRKNKQLKGKKWISNSYLIMRQSKEKILHENENKQF